MPDIYTAMHQAAREAGFDAFGISPLSRFPELQYLSTWIAEGRNGDMRYLESTEPGGMFKRVAVERVYPWARSVLVGAVNYNTVQPYSDGSQPGALYRSWGSGSGKAGDEGDSGRSLRSSRTPPAGSRNRRRGWISRYAWAARDYHDEVLRCLQQLEARLRQLAGTSLRTRCYVDTGPLVERVYARHAGLGWIGKNTCLINERLGSWLFLGVILTSLPPEALSTTAPLAVTPDRCGGCTRCLDACPTQALTAPYRMDASRCIAYLTIEKREVVPDILRPAVGMHVFGCDICQEVCPWNRRAPITQAPALQPQPELVNADLVWLATISEEEFQARFRHSPIGRTKRRGLRRNAVIAMGNSGDRGFLPLLESLTGDADPVVASHARWAASALVSSDEKPSR